MRAERFGEALQIGTAEGADHLPGLDHDGRALALREAIAGVSQRVVRRELREFSVHALSHTSRRARLVERVQQIAAGQKPGKPSAVEHEKRGLGQCGRLRRHFANTLQRMQAQSDRLHRLADAQPAG